MMSEQTANLCTTDACESLRARLAKYEDAEGRPVVAGDQGNLIKYLREAEKTLGGKLNSGIYGKAADALESQAREIERLTEKAGNWDKWCANAKPVKAQPSGVVLPERKDESKHRGTSLLAVRQWNKCLDEVARLNTSPVSAGEPVYQFQCREIGEGEWGPCDYSRYLYCQKSPEHDTKVVQVGVSAGGVDERAAIPTVKDCMRRAGYEDYHGRIAFTVGQFERFVELVSDRALQARAALTASAPAVPDDAQARLAEIDAMLAAAPSAGSRGGDV